MRGSRIPSGKRIINSVAPLDPSDMSEANALNLMFLYDNEGTGDYLEDASIKGRHDSRGYAREQASPNMTLEVLTFIAWFAQNSYVAFAGGNSPAFVAPAVNPRRDVLTLRSDGSLYVIQGVEGASPAVPTIPSTDIPIAQIYNVVGETVIHDNDQQVGGQGYIEYDLRPFVQVAVGASAMPKIGIVAKAQASNTNSALSDVVNFTGAGRLRAIHALSTVAGAATHNLVITIDGVVFYTQTAATLPANDTDIILSGAGSTATLVTAAGTTTSYIFLDLFFKTSLRVQHRTNDATTITTTVAYEHE